MEKVLQNLKELAIKTSIVDVRWLSSQLKEILDLIDNQISLSEDEGELNSENQTEQLRSQLGEIQLSDIHTLDKIL